MQRFRGGLVFKAHRLCASLNSRLESNEEEEEGTLNTSENRFAKLIGQEEDGGIKSLRVLPREVLLGYEPLWRYC